MDKEMFRLMENICKILYESTHKELIKFSPKGGNVNVGELFDAITSAYVSSLLRLLETLSEGDKRIEKSVEIFKIKLRDFFENSGSVVTQAYCHNKDMN